MDPSTTSGFIMGLGDSTSTSVVTPDLTVLLKKTEAMDACSIPTPTNLLNLDNLNELAALQTGSTEIKPRNFTAVPPFLVMTMHQSMVASHGDPLAALVAAVTIIKHFNNAHTDDEGFIDKATQKSKQFIFWLVWTRVIEDCPIKQIPLEPCSNANLRATFAMIQASHIKCPSNETNSSDALQLSLNQFLAGASSLTTQQAINLMANNPQSADKRGDSKKSTRQHSEDGPNCQHYQPSSSIQAMR